MPKPNPTAHASSRGIAQDCSILIIQSEVKAAEPLMSALACENLAGRVALVADAREAEEYLFREGRFVGAHGRPVPLFLLVDSDDETHTEGLLRRVRADPMLRYVVVVALTDDREKEHRVDVENLGIVLYLRKPSGDCSKFAAQLRRLIPDAAL